MRWSSAATMDPKRARRGRRRGPLNTSCATARAWGPLTRSKATAPVPEGVDRAAMVSAGIRLDMVSCEAGGIFAPGVRHPGGGRRPLLRDFDDLTNLHSSPALG